MTEPLRAVHPPVDGSPLDPTLTRAYRARLVWRGLRARVVGPARLLPGLAAVACAVAGSWLLWGIGVALLVAVPFLLLVDARTPRS